MFTDEEIKAAKATRDEIIRNDISTLKSIYMAGEICMWDELQSHPSQEAPEQGEEEFNSSVRLNHLITSAFEALHKIANMELKIKDWKYGYIEIKKIAEQVIKNMPEVKEGCTSEGDSHLNTAHPFTFGAAPLPTLQPKGMTDYETALAIEYGKKEWASEKPDSELTFKVSALIDMSTEDFKAGYQAARTALDSLPGEGGDGSPYCPYCGNAKKSFGDGSIRPLCTCPK